VDFTRKVAVQAQDSFPPKADIAEIDAFIREQKVPGELIVSYPGNSGRTSVIFRGKAQVRPGEILTDE
jgi:hypothetical protein